MLVVVIHSVTDKTRTQICVHPAGFYYYSCFLHFDIFDEKNQAKNGEITDFDKKNKHSNVTAVL
jgi:hypothetical protein